MTEQELGFIGVGDMGGPMAMRLVDAGLALTVHDIRAEAVAPFVEKGATAADSPKAVADAMETVLVCLPTPDVVREVALGPDGLIHGGAIKTYVDLSTTGAVMAKEVAAALTGAGIACLDCPVSGGVTGARAGTLSLMMSGSKELAERMTPTLLNIGANPFYLGAAPGLGQTMKVANNYLSAAANIACAEALVMGVKAGIDPKVMLDTINASSGRSSASEVRYPQSVLPRDFSTGFKQRLLHKDVRLCMEEAAALDVPMWLGNMVRQFLAYAVSQGAGDEVSIALVKHVERWAGVEVGKKAE
jgi:3-hydroxyisobutyrate dehydrogenase-like beta-hydroxyacid dehydrogenase